MAEAIDVALSPSERTILATPPTRDPEAYAAYVRGQDMARRFSANQDEALGRRAIAEFDYATRRDPRFADALASAAQMRSQIRPPGPGVQPLLDTARALADSALADSLTRVVAALRPGDVGTLRFQLMLAFQRGDTAEMGNRYSAILRAVGPLSPSLWYLLEQGSAEMQHTLDTLTLGSVPVIHGRRASSTTRRPSARWFGSVPRTRERSRTRWSIWCAQPLPRASRRAGLRYRGRSR